MQAGDKLQLLREAEDEGWYVARDERGKEGLGPATHINVGGPSVPAIPSLHSTGEPSANAPAPPAVTTTLPKPAAQANLPQPPSSSLKFPTAAVAKFPYKAAGDDELSFAVCITVSLV